jgi:acyl carrier protein
MAELDPAQVLAAMHDIARTELDYVATIALTQRLNEDLHLDSMNMIVMAVGLENRFRIKLDEQDAGQLITVGDLVTLVVRRAQEQA